VRKFFQASDSYDSISVPDYALPQDMQCFKQSSALGIELSQEQQQVIDAVLSGHNVFLTGDAGTGKSIVIDAIKKHLGKRVQILAPTGMAACNHTEGMTIHNFFSFNVLDLTSSHRNKQAIDATEIIIVDEVSMLSQYLLNAMNDLLQRYYLENNPYHDPLMHPPVFGGKQVVFVGDFYQLPAVQGNTDCKFVFNDPLWGQAGFVTFELTKAFRQIGDVHFQRLLSIARKGLLSSEELDALNSRVVNDIASVPKDAIFLCYTNERVNYYNKRSVKALGLKKDDFVRFCALDDGSSLPRKDIQAHLKPFSVENTLTLFIGAKVVMTRNNGSHYHNGSIGKVVAFRQIENDYEHLEDVVSVEIKGNIYDVRKVSFTTYHENKEVYWSQFPMRLGYAITVHKAQGQTYDCVLIDRSGCKGVLRGFHGQLYTALSRVKSLSGVYLVQRVSARDFVCEL